MREYPRVGVTMFDRGQWAPEAIVTVYGENAEEHCVDLKLCGHLIGIHGITPESLDLLADQIYNAARTLREKRAPMSEPAAPQSVTLPTS